MNSIAPMSTPRVGWPTSRAFGAAESSRATTIFCWLPPEKPPQRRSGSGGRTSKRSMSPSHRARIAARARKMPSPASAALWYPRMDDSEAVNGRTSPRCCRSSGMWASPMPRRREGSGGADAENFLPANVMLPDWGGSIPDRTSRSSVCPFPATPAMPRISPARSSKATSVRRGAPRSSAWLSDSTTRIGAPGSPGSPPTVNSTSRPTISRASSSWLVSRVGRRATISPRRITYTMSVAAMISRSLWVMRRMVTPSRLRIARISNSRSASCGVSTPVGSSRIRMRAPRSRALRISTRC